MRTIDGRLLADLNDNVPAYITGSVESPTTASINENDTAYALLPERINAVPYISSSIYKTSTPEIKPIQYNDPNRYYLYVDNQGVVKVAVGSNFTFRLIAKQPPIYNVENGVPTIYEDQTKLSYQWLKDGEPISSDNDVSRPGSYITVTGSNAQEMVFTNVSPKFAGTYTCIASNDVGSVESEQIVLEVYNPDIEDYFYRNLVDNPYGKDGVNGWSADQEFTVSRLTNTDFKNFSQPWSTNIFGYSVDMFYPRPYHLNTYHIRNNNLSQDLLQEGYYFTRERFKYKVKDGKALVTAVYDLDLTPIQEYIQGAIYGVDGVRAIFGCYIGMAISKYRTTAINALITRRSAKYSLLPNITRLNIINCLLAGLPNKTEDVKVMIHEYDNETPLLSTEPNGNKSQGFSLSDPWNEKMYEVSNIWPPVKAYPTSPGGTNEDKIIYIADNNILHPDKTYQPTYGQYVKFNRLVIDKLNYKTNKVRITVHFENFDNILNITDRQHVDNSDECFELVPWDWIAKPMVWPKTPETDYVKDPNNPTQNANIDWWNQKILNLKSNQPFDYATQLGLPRAMVTGFNFVLVPLERQSPQKATYYANTILKETTTPLYPKLNNGTSESTPLGLYMASLLDYESKVVAVNVQNRYNLRYQGKKTIGNFAAFVDQENARADVGFRLPQRVSSRTTVSTYVYDPTNESLQPDAFEYPSSATVNAYNSSSYVWRLKALSDYEDFNPNISGSDQVIVVYNSEVADIDECNLSQIAGNISSTLVKYINIVTDVPLAFTTSSVTKNVAINSLGLQLNLIGQDYGVETSESLTGPALGNERYNDWKTFRATVGTATVDIPLVYKIGTTTTVNISFFGSTIPVYSGTRITKPSQHIIYSENFATNWGSNTYTTTYDKSEQFTLLTGSFAFTTSSAIERGLTYVYTRWESDDNNINNTITREAEFASQIVRGLYNNAIANSVYRTTLIPNKDYNNNTYSGEMLATRTYTETVYRPTTIPAFPSYNGERREPGARATWLARGGTVSRVELQSVKNYGDIRTPAAIIIPSKKRIWYFIYSYKDNYYNESL